MEYLIYQIKLSGLISIYYLIYRIIYFENRFQFKRIFLLASLLLAIITPFIHIHTNKLPLDNVQINLPEVIVNVNSAVKGIRNANNFWLFWLMLLFPLLYITQLFNQIHFIFKLKRNADVSYSGKYKIFNINANDSFTFFNCLYISRNIETQNRNVVIKHELIHARKLHSIDILFIDFLILIQWYNPFIWFFKRQ
jgi:bla regulator protein blaR1